MKKNDFVNAVKEEMMDQYDPERYVSKSIISKRITEYVRQYCGNSYKKLNAWMDSSVDVGFDEPIEQLTSFCLE